MPKVLFCVNITAHLRAFHLPLLNWFRERGWSVHVAAGDCEAVPGAHVQHRLALSRSPFKWRNGIGVLRLCRILEVEHFHIIHCQTPMGGAAARIATLLMRGPTRPWLIYSAHGFHFYKGAPLLNWIIYYPMERALAGVTDVLITVNGEDGDRVRRSRFSARRHLRIPIGVDLERFSLITANERERIRSNLQIPTDSLTLMYVAELSERKNQKFLIRLMPVLRRRLRNVLLMLVGADSLGGCCQHLASSLGVSDAVLFMGRRDNVPDLLAASDIYVSPSRQEGLPLNVMEAMARGLPVLATKIRGHIDVIEEGISGYTAAVDDEQEFVNKIVALATQPDLRNGIARRARKAILPQSTVVLEEMMFSLYRSLSSVENGPLPIV